MQYKKIPIEKILLSIILFYAALVFCLPVAPSEEFEVLYPWWAKRISFGNVLLHEFVFLIWGALFGKKLLNYIIKNNYPTRNAAIWLVVLALWCGIISLTAPLPLIDIGRTFRLLLMAVLMLAIVKWTLQFGNYPLIILIIGYFVGTIINLIISFEYPVIVVGVMRLAGQNTPGVAMGIAIHLSAWQYCLSNKTHIRIFLIISMLIFLFSCAISFSRIGWFTAFCGLISWAYVLFVNINSAQGKFFSIRFRGAITRMALISIIGIIIISSNGQNIIEWFVDLINQKIERQGDSNDQRTAYLVGTAEILFKYPFGVGYSGFYDAMTATETYTYGNAALEDDPESANPHASILWYLTTGGFPAGILFVTVLVSMLNSMKNGMVVTLGRSGLFLFALVFFPYLLIVGTVSYIFNSIILLAPAAIIAGIGAAKKLKANNQYLY